MKTRLLLFILLFAGMAFSQDESPTHDSLSPIYIDTVLMGDLNNDRISDTAFVLTPRTVDSYDEQGELVFSFGCENDTCYNSIRFSNGFPELWIGNSVWGSIESAGDLNGDGVSEILFCYGWFTSVWHKFGLYALKDGQWQEVTSVSLRWDDEEKALRDFLIQKKGKWYLQGTEFKDDDFVPYEVKIPAF